MIICQIIIYITWNQIKTNTLSPSSVKSSSSSDDDDDESAPPRMSEKSISPSPLESESPSEMR